METQLRRLAGGAHRPVRPAWLRRAGALSAALWLFQFLLLAGSGGSPAAAEPHVAPFSPSPAAVSAETDAAAVGRVNQMLLRVTPTPPALAAARLSPDTPSEMSAPSRSPAPGPPTTAGGGSAAETAAEPPLQVVIQPGDTLYALAQRYRVPLELLQAYNKIEDPHRLHAGFVLQIPTEASLKRLDFRGGGAPILADVYVVQPGDTMTSIAERFGLDVGQIARFNNLATPEDLRAGQLLSLTGPLTGSNRGGPPSPTPTPEPSPTPAAPGSLYVVQAGDTLGLIASRHRMPVELLRDENELANNIIYIGQRIRIPALNYRELPPLGALQWPVTNHWVIKGYFYGHAAIDMLMPVGSPIIAAAPGVVEIAGWHAYGYGYVIVVDHGHGIRTLYAHLSEIAVSEGQRVARGEPLGLSGHTGWSTHPHLHFEVQKAGRGLNPCLYLEGGCN